MATALDYARLFPNQVRYLEHDGHVNRGMSASRNLGIREARGARRQGQFRARRRSIQDCRR
jgi:hypothetical protein